jgi:hypothetical protein
MIADHFSHTGTTRTHLGTSDQALGIAAEECVSRDPAQPVRNAYRPRDRLVIEAVHVDIGLLWQDAARGVHCSAEVRRHMVMLGRPVGPV